MKPSRLRLAKGSPYVFISYVRQDLEQVERLVAALERRRIPVWMDIADLPPGKPWEREIGCAIDGSVAFIACFSAAFENRDQAYMDEELRRGVQHIARREGWFIPVSLSPCNIPDLPIDLSRTILALHVTHLDEASPDWKRQVDKLAADIRTRLPQRRTRPLMAGALLLLAIAAGGVMTLETRRVAPPGDIGPPRPPIPDRAAPAIGTGTAEGASNAPVARAPRAGPANPPAATRRGTARPESPAPASSPAPTAVSVAARNAAFAATYRNPQVVEPVWRGELDAVVSGEVYAKRYLVAIARTLSTRCSGGVFDRRQVDDLETTAALTAAQQSREEPTAALFGGLVEYARMTRGAAAELIRLKARDAKDMAAIPDEAQADALLLIGRYGCSGADIDRFSTHLRSYVDDVGAPRLSAPALWTQCVQHARAAGRYRGADFCQCFIPALTQSPVSRANRKGLSTDFWRTTEHMIATEAPRYRHCIDGIE